MECYLHFLRCPTHSVMRKPAIGQKFGPDASTRIKNIPSSISWYPKHVCVNKDSALHKIPFLHRCSIPLHIPSSDFIFLSITENQFNNVQIVAPNSGKLSCTENQSSFPSWNPRIEQLSPKPKNHPYNPLQAHN